MAAETTNDKPTGTMTPDLSSPGASTAPPPRVPLFALIIGINAYPNLTKLSGAVADAEALKDYLEEVVRVPEEHIRTLFDKQATRSAIIGAFKELCVDKRIRNGDPIIIFYAGHGGELPSPRKWGRDGKIQCILPYDYKCASIDPIPDCSIGALITDIAKAKGNNITVIFDCCHSASGTRDADERYVPRGVALNHGVPEDLDHQIWGGRAVVIPKGLASHGLRSHVLLAACGEKELAYEYEGHGQFTTALLTALKQSGLNELTYTGLLKRIQLPKQNPQCDGFHRERALFNARVSAGRQVRYSVLVLDDFKYVISAGLAHGVSRGAEFTLFSNDKQRVNTIAVDDTAVIEDFQTTVATSVHLTNDSFGRLSRIGKVPFYLAPEGSLPASFLGALSGESPDVTNFRLVERADEAKLEVGVVGKRGVFKILDQRVNGFGLTNLAHTIPLRHLAYVLNTAAHYYWYLDLTNKNNRAEHAVAVDFYPLQMDYDDWGNDVWAPGPNEPGLCQKDRSWGNSESDVIDFVVDPNAVYGIKFTNNTHVDLYLSAFLFNSSKLSIDQCYTQSIVGNPEAPLKQNSTFTLGYGTGGAIPLAFLLDEGQDVDISYLKVYFATQPIDLSWIVQASPIEDLDDREFPEEEARKARLSVSKSAQPRGGAVDTWFTVEIPIVQRRR